ncbi:MAG TPA: hypothetical protein VGL62_14345, partial [Vicinamibacterales bacterium]
MAVPFYGPVFFDLAALALRTFGVSIWRLRASHRVRARARSHSDPGYPLAVLYWLPGMSAR